MGPKMECAMLQMVDKTLPYVISETYMTGRLLVGADLRAARGEWGASHKPAGSEIRPYQLACVLKALNTYALRTVA